MAIAFAITVWWITGAAAFTRYALSIEREFTAMDGMVCFFIGGMCGFFLVIGFLWSLIINLLVIGSKDIASVISDSSKRS